MKTCPVCKAVAFDDARICYGCLHRYDWDEPGEGSNDGLGGSTDMPDKGLSPSPPSGQAGSFGEDRAFSEGDGAAPDGVRASGRDGSSVAGGIAEVADGAGVFADGNGSASEKIASDQDSSASGSSDRTETVLSAGASSKSAVFPGSAAFPWDAASPGAAAAAPGADAHRKADAASGAAIIQSDGWTLRIELSSAVPPSNGLGGAPRAGLSSPPRFSLTEDGFLVSIGSRRLPRAPVGGRRQEAGPSRSVLRRRLESGRRARGGAPSPKR